ncbi:MAG: hypothetical protein II086_02540, partial [Ruminococcus sp.]|nr:hypothetical protein [Ruminococcus sp.]
RCIGISTDVDADVVRSAAGLAAQGHLFEIVNCTINKNVTRALEIVDSLYKDSKDMGSLCEELQSHFRSLMLIKTVSKPRELVVMSDREFDAAVAEADYLSLPDILFAMDVLGRARAAMRESVSPRTELEMALVKLCAPELDKTDEALFARVTALEKALRLLQSNGVPVAQPSAHAPELPKPTVEQKAEEKKPEPVQETTPADPEPMKDTAPEKPEPEQKATPEKPQPAETSAQQPISAPAVDSKPVAQSSAVPTAKPEHKAPARRQNVDMDELYRNAKPFELWPDVVANLRNYSRAISAAFEDTNAYVSGDYLLIETNHEIAFELLKKSAQREEIRKAVQEVTGKVYKLGPYKQPEEKKQSKDEVLDDFIDKLKSSGVNVTED